MVDRSPACAHAARLLAAVVFALLVLAHPSVVSGDVVGPGGRAAAPAPADEGLSEQDLMDAFGGAAAAGMMNGMNTRVAWLFETATAAGDVEVADVSFAAGFPMRFLLCNKYMRGAAYLELAEDEEEGQGQEGGGKPKPRPRSRVVEPVDDTSAFVSAILMQGALATLPAPYDTARVLVLGLNDGLVANRFLEKEVGLLEVVEENDAVVSAAGSFFGFRRNEADAVHIESPLSFILRRAEKGPEEEEEEEEEERYDLVVHDLQNFDHPWELLTREFWTLLRDRWLDADGVVAVTLTGLLASDKDYPTAERVLPMLVATLRSVFAQVRCYNELFHDMSDPLSEGADWVSTTVCLATPSDDPARLMLKTQAFFRRDSEELPRGSPLDIADQVLRSFQPGWEVLPPEATATAPVLTADNMASLLADERVVLRRAIEERLEELLPRELLAPRDSAHNARERKRKALAEKKAKKKAAKEAAKRARATDSDQQHDEL